MTSTNRNDIARARPLDALLSGLDHEVRGDASVPVHGVAYRSDEVRPGWLFFCVPGSHTDGHRFAGDAATRGAVAVVVERWLDDLDEAVVQVKVPSVREAMGPVSAESYGRPSDRMVVVGITGTNGKTTTTYLMESVFREAGMLPGVIGTTGVRIGGQPLPLARTTPEAPDLHRVFAEMEHRDVDAVAMEVSSHGLHQHRIGGVRFDTAVFTNLSQDHLDYHADLEDYFAAKAMLFTPARTAQAVVNVDDPYGRRLVDSGVPTVTFGLEAASADVRAEDVETTSSGLSFRVGDLTVRSRLRGLFNVYNCLGALASARTVGIADAATVAGLGTVEGVPGRLEPVEEGQGFLVVVDYAHTPDSIENVLRAAGALTGPDGRLIVVFGAGGDRDRTKRPSMGRAATSAADLTVITSDNPRSEEPMDIIGMIEPGAREGGGEYVIEPDRRAAIRLAVRQAGPGDVVVIAGKGHETGQEFADGRTIPFDDRVVAGEELRAMVAEVGS